MNWREQSECRRTHANPNWFFPDGNTVDIRLAKAVCACCPVARECRQYALDHDEQGIWGGTTDSERARFKRNRRHFAVSGGAA